MRSDGHVTMNVGAWDTPLCPAGHLPLKGGDRQDAPTSPIYRPTRWPTGCRESISPLVGEMSGRTEGSERHIKTLNRVSFSGRQVRVHLH